jgi:heat shock protein HslJ
MKKIVFAFIIALIIVQCQPKNQTTMPSNSSPQKENSTSNATAIHRVWKLVSYTNFDAEKIKLADATLDLTDTKSGTAKMGCNTLNFDYTVDGSNKIKFGDVLATRMACLDMELENSFSKNCSTFTSYTVENHKLVLKNTSNQEMVFVAEDWD